jgi:hypothetical protein
MVSNDHDSFHHPHVTRRVVSLVKALGVDTGISKYTMSEIDAEVRAFRSRPLVKTSGLSYRHAHTMTPGAALARVVWRPSCQSGNLLSADSYQQRNYSVLADRRSYPRYLAMDPLPHAYRRRSPRFDFLDLQIEAADSPLGTALGRSVVF